MSSAVNLHQNLNKDGGETKYPGKHASLRVVEFDKRMCGETRIPRDTCAGKHISL